MSDIPEIEFHGMGPHVDAVYQSCWENCYKKFLSLTINVKNLTKPVDRKLMSDVPEIKSHDIGPHVDDVCQISRGWLW
jgi:hypothetical protein